MSDHEPSRVLEDNFGRRFPYLRLSITDVCNFRCTYCLPNGYEKPEEDKGKKNVFLTREEIGRIIRAFAAMGTWKVRITGGEPTLRKDFTPIIQDVAGTEGIEHIAFTTNGYRLPERAEEFYNAGLRAINISLDTMNAGRFKELTGHDRFNEVIEGIDAAFEAGFDPVKVNTVLLKGINDDQLGEFLDFIRHRPISLRFIEFMRTRDNVEYFLQHHVSASKIRERLEEQGWTALPRKPGAGPAVEMTHPDYAGTIGIIAPYAKDFCSTCNRLRISARGGLHLCLFGDGGYNLRHLMQSDDQQEELQDKLLELMQFKRATHNLHEGDPGARKHLASIGG